MAIYSNSLEGLCERVYARLGDSDQESWDKCQVETAVFDALSMLAILRRELFVREVEIELAVDECVQTLPEECSTIVSYKCVEVNGVRTPVSEGEFNTIENTALHPPTRRGRKRGAGGVSFGTVVANYQVATNPNNPRSFAISPTPQAGETVKLIGDCESVSTFEGDITAEFPTEVRPYLIPLVELALYQLYSSDREVPELAALASQSLQAFLNMTAITQGAVNAVLAAQGEG